MADVIPRLKKFSKLDVQSKRELINNGRPMPELKDLVQRTGQKITRSFQSEWYNRKEWLCGCATRNRLFCYPCLLFSTRDNVWTNVGFCDLKNLPRSLSKHESSTTHIQSQIDLKTFETSRIDLALNEQRRLSITIHNSKVKENLEMLKDLINAICFLAKQELAFSSNDESASSSNRGNYVELLHAFAEKDERLARHLETSNVFSGMSNGIQNDLIEAVGDVIRSDIKKDIDAAPFVAVEVDETTDANNKAQISVILRYVAKGEASCEVREAFLGFDDVSGDRRASVIARYVLGVLERYKCVEKLVAQTYDGASVIMSSELNRVQAKIKEKMPVAMFTHCYAHKLNLVLQHSAKSMPECRTFFKKIEGLGTFFNKSIKRTQLLEDVVKGRLPRAEPTRWSSKSRLLHTVSMYQSDLLAVFRIMSENPDSWDNDTVIMASGYEQWLSKASTCFLIMAYDGIFTETDALFRVLQDKVMDNAYCCAQIRKTIGAVEGQRQEFESFYERFEQKCTSLELTDSVRSQQPVRDERKRLFCNILDNITAQLKVRFDHFGELAFLGLVDCTKFNEMSKNFDDKKLKTLSKYGRFFDFVRLKADLIGLYSSQTVRDECKSPAQLLSFLAQKKLMQTVPEATKLLQLALTIPATTVSAERSFSALKRINTYRRNYPSQGRLSSLAIISIETERLQKLKEDKENFYGKVTEIFVKKERRMDFIYKPSYLGTKSGSRPEGQKPQQSSSMETCESVHTSPHEAEWENGAPSVESSDEDTDSGNQDDAWRGQNGWQPENKAIKEEEIEEFRTSLTVRDGFYVLDLGSSSEFIVDEECILQLFRSCRECNRNCTVKKHVKGLKLVVYQTCCFCRSHCEWTNLPGDNDKEDSDSQIDGKDETRADQHSSVTKQ